MTNAVLAECKRAHTERQPSEPGKEPRSPPAAAMRRTYGDGTGLKGAGGLGITGSFGERRNSLRTSSRTVWRENVMELLPLTRVALMGWDRFHQPNE